MESLVGDKTKKKCHAHLSFRYSMWDQTRLKMKNSRPVTEDDLKVLMSLDIAYGEPSFPSSSSVRQLTPSLWGHAWAEEHRLAVSERNGGNDDGASGRSRRSNHQVKDAAAAAAQVHCGQRSKTRLTAPKGRSGRPKTIQASPPLSPCPDDQRRLRGNKVSDDEQEEFFRNPAQAARSCLHPPTPPLLPPLGFLSGETPFTWSPPARPPTALRHSLLPSTRRRFAGQQVQSLPLRQHANHLQMNLCIFDEEDEVDNLCLSHGGEICMIAVAKSPVSCERSRII